MCELFAIRIKPLWRDRDARPDLQARLDIVTAHNGAGLTPARVSRRNRLRNPFTSDDGLCLPNAIINSFVISHLRQ